LIIAANIAQAIENSTRSKISLNLKFKILEFSRGYFCRQMILKTFSKKCGALEVLLDTLENITITLCIVSLDELMNLSSTELLMPRVNAGKNQMYICKPVSPSPKNHVSTTKHC
jgi:hypothetical protein